jgi:drug/metabolite transporter (DMT)-like permease
LAAGAAYGALAALIWAGFPAITKLAMASNTLTAWDVTALRFGVAGAILLPVFWRRGLGALRWPVALLLACGAGAPYVLLTAGGLAFAPAGHMGVITPSCMLLFSALGSRFILHDRLSAGRVLGVLTIFCGIVILGWDGLTNHGDRTWLGDLMFLAGGLFWASYTVGSRVWSVDPFHATAVVAVLSMLLYIPAYAVFADSQIATAPWSEIVIQSVFQGVLSAVVALLLYTRSVAILGAARGAVFAALVPSFSLLLAIPMLGEIPTPLQLVGVVLVTAGMVFALGLHDPAKWRRARSAAAST